MRRYGELAFDLLVAVREAQEKVTAAGAARLPTARNRRPMATVPITQHQRRAGAAYSLMPDIIATGGPKPASLGRRATQGGVAIFDGCKPLKM
jgi:hypothetical protein